MGELNDMPCGFFIPTTLDFRGRHTPDVQPNFHAADYIRACFLLANKKPVGADGTRWLMVEAATLGDWKVGDKRVSKMSFEDRDRLDSGPFRRHHLPGSKKLANNLRHMEQG